jgi:hypothetical protein
MRAGIVVKVTRADRHRLEVKDVVGLYIDPPAHAVVLSVDEKSQIQALDRTQPGLPMKQGRAGTMTRDYKRHGTTTLFAALNILAAASFNPCPRITEIAVPDLPKHAGWTRVASVMANHRAHSFREPINRSRLSLRF